MAEPAPPPLPAPLTFASGVLMGAADSVPGVSGGTIALVLGIYERLLEGIVTMLALPRLVRSPEGRRRLGRALRFLVPLGLGVVAAYYVGTWLLVGATDRPGLLRRAETAPLCYAFFFGLVIVSLREPWRHIHRRGVRVYATVVVAAGLTAWFVGLPYATEEPPTWRLLYGGALAISVMLLPGVSGSLLLVILGQYTTVAGAIHDRHWGTLGVFLAGILLGLALFVPVLRRLLLRHKDLTLAALTGLMAGSLRALWPWKSHYDLKDLAAGPMQNVGVGDDWLLVVGVAVAGGLAAWALRFLERRIERASA